MFDHKHYVPILRWKRGEWIALRYLNDNVKAHITPLVELTPRNFRDRKKKPQTTDQILSEIAAEIHTSWGSTLFFVDLCHLDESLSTCNRFHPLQLLSEEIRSRNMHVIPVTGLTRSRRVSECCSIDHQSGPKRCVYSPVTG